MANDVNADNFHPMKYFLTFLICTISLLTVHAQDILVHSNGDIERTTILGTDFSSVKYTLGDGSAAVLGLKELKEFVWNGETYTKKTFFDQKKAQDRFAKVIELGTVNLYAIGGANNVASAPESRVKVRPSIGIGTGTGGMGGGIGGSISIGGGRRAQEPVSRGSKTFYFIEKPGTGAIQEVPVSDTRKTAAILLQKLGDDTDLAERIKGTDEFTSNALIAFIKAYNANK